MVEQRGHFAARQLVLAHFGCCHWAWRAGRGHSQQEADGMLEAAGKAACTPPWRSKQMGWGLQGVAPVHPE
jgi:hypothetical protein